MSNQNNQAMYQQGRIASRHNCSWLFEMAKGDKVLLSPGFIANCMPVYERERMENIRRNNEVCRSLGVQRITSSSIGLGHHKCSTAKAKRTKHSSDELDDFDYRPQDDEDDHDDIDSHDSFEQEIIEMPPSGRPTYSYPEPRCIDNVMFERVTWSTPQSDMDSQSLPTLITQPQSKELTNNNVVLLVDHCMLTPWLRIDKFDLQGNPTHVDKIVARQCERTLSNFTYRLHKNYQKLKDTRGELYA